MTGHRHSPLGNFVNRWISPFMPRQNSEDGWWGSDTAGSAAEADTPEVGGVGGVGGVGDEPEASAVPEEGGGEEDEAGQPFHGGGRWHAPAMWRPPWKMVRVGRMDFLNPKWWPVGSGPWANFVPIHGSVRVSFSWVVGSWTVFSGGTRVTWELSRR